MNHPLRTLVGTVFLICVLMGCASEETAISNDVEAAPNTETEPEPEIPAPAIQEEPADDANFLFDDDTIRTYELVVEPEDMEFLNNDPVAEVYVPATLKFEGQEYESVGLRYKGSAGSFINCTQGFTFPPSGPKTCIKLSMKVKINYGDSDLKFHGLKKLQFHSMNSDESLMKERLAYYLFRSMGIPAPRTAPTRLVINGELVGLFLLVEQIDGRFTRSRFEEGGKGNLYKEIWPIHTDDALYLNALKTNEDENPSVDKMQRLRTQLGNATQEELPSISDAWMDRDYMARYLAVDRTIQNDDGAMHWYCNVSLGQGGNTGECGNHNYYWYEEEKNDRMWLIPWDTDLAFREQGMTVLPIPWNEVPSSCEPVQMGMFGYLPAACDPLIYAWTTFTDEYSQAVRTLIDGPYSEENVTMLLEKWQAQIASTVEEAYAQDSEHLRPETWLNAINQFKGVVNRLRTRAETVASSHTATNN